MAPVVRRCALPLAIALVLLGTAACGSDSDDPEAGLRGPSVDSSDTRAHRLMNLVERTDSLSTLTRALRQAGLAEDLRQGGPHTLFAPTDRAFQQYWFGFDSLLAPAGTSSVGTSGRGRQQQTRGEASARYRDSLRQVLSFHLVSGRFTAADLTDSLRLGTLVGESLLLQRAGGAPASLRVLVKGTPGPVPIARTIEAQNGVIHVLPQPLRIPPPDTSTQGALRPSDTTGTSAPDGN